MAGLEVSNRMEICHRCSQAFGRKKGYFSVSYGSLYKGSGYLPYCSKCVDDMYNAYLEESKSAKDSVRQMCRKLDLYWNSKIFDNVESTSATRSMITNYLSKINGVKYAGKCYDDTLREERCLWKGTSNTVNEPLKISEDESLAKVDPELIAFWGTGFEPNFYVELDQRYTEWTGGNIIPDVGKRNLYKQICLLEAIISKDAAAGKSVDKNMNSLNALYGSANVKPQQKKKDEADAGLDATPFGGWVRKWEEERPLPEPDPELQDGSKIIKYVLTWFAGHIGKLLGIKNLRSTLYEKEMEKYRVNMPEYEGDDDDTLLSNIFGSDSGGGGI